MRIGYDAKKAVSNLTGIGNYSRRIINAVSKEDASTEVLLFAPHKTNVKATREITVPTKTVNPSKRGALPLLWWRNTGMCKDIKECNVEIFHGLSNELPFGIHKLSCKTVVTIHDLIFRILPHTFGWADRHILTLKTQYACKHADCVVAVSECTKRDIIKLYGTPEDKIKVVYQSINDIFRTPLPKEQCEKVRQERNLPEKYILCVGTIEERKNQATVVEALRWLPEEYHVVLVGGRTPYAKTIDDIVERCNLKDRVHIVSGLSNIELPALYQMATVFALMSRYEGFGIPIAEALAMGTPVIAAKGSCLEEAGGHDSIYLSPDDAKGLADNVLKIESDETLRQNMVSKGKEYSLLFTDEMQAKAMLNIYKGLTTH
ncbi:MAG: glycosyltransferase family 4 protein [Prevotella sp.]|nr:glycosyltransferase family 4 protein [Candidatus Prevotella equi]